MSLHGFPTSFPGSFLYFEKDPGNEVAWFPCDPRRSQVASSRKHSQKQTFPCNRERSQSQLWSHLLVSETVKALTRLLRSLKFVDVDSSLYPLPSPLTTLASQAPAVLSFLHPTPLNYHLTVRFRYRRKKEKVDLKTLPLCFEQLLHLIHRVENQQTPW